MITTPAVVKPADIVSSTENFLAIATAAMAYGCQFTWLYYRLKMGAHTFIGWTGRGTANMS